jgi:RimJ/RimL family protein N-acetyltransferase
MISFLKGEHVCLRAVELTDATERYLGWINNPEVTKGLVTGTYPSSLVQLTNYIESAVSDRSKIMLAICDNQTGLHIGNVKLDQIDAVARTAEFGLMIGDQAFWGTGIGTEVSRLVLHYAFEQLNLRKVSLSVFSNNPGAIRLYQKVGFTVEGRLKDHVFADNAYHDKLWMSIFKHDFEHSM